MFAGIQTDSLLRQLRPTVCALSRSGSVVLLVIGPKALSFPGEFTFEVNAQAALARHSSESELEMSLLSRGKSSYKIACLRFRGNRFVDGHAVQLCAKSSKDNRLCLREHIPLKTIKEKEVPR